MRHAHPGTRALRLYRSVPGALPTAGMDGRILTAARHAAQRSPDRRQLMFIGAMAATVLVAFTARSLIEDPLLPESRAFGLSEGQSRDYLLQFDPLTTGPGSQEGVP